MMFSVKSPIYKRNNQMRKFPIFLIAIILVLLMAATVVNAGAKRITDNTYGDYNPQIDGNNVVWEGNTAGSRQIFMYNGSTVTTLSTDINQANYEPQIDGNNVVWEGETAGDTQIFMYNGSTVTTLSTDINFANYDPQIDGNNVVWEGNIAGSRQIFMYNGSTVTTLSTDINYANYDPQIDGNNVVWEGNTAGSRQIFMYDGSVVTTLSTDINLSNENPQIDGGNVVWYGDGSHREIYLYDGSRVINISDNPYGNDDDPQISGNKVVWEGDDGLDDEIFIRTLPITLDPASTWDSGVGHWNLNGNKLAAGDFNGDGFDDVAVLYGYKSTRQSRLHVFISNGDNTFKSPTIWWDSGPNNWDWEGSKLTSGDYNDDGNTDLAILYGYQSTRQTKAWVFKSDGANSFNAPTQWWDSGPNNWDWNGSKLTSGDFNGDGPQDLAVLYGYGSTRQTKAWVFTSDGTASLNSPAVWWDSGPNNWDWNGSKLTSGDYNDDGNTDLAVLYGYKANRDVRTWVFESSTGNFNPPTSWWQAGPGNWDWNGSRVYSGDFNGLNGDDLSIFYSYASDQSAIFDLTSNNNDGFIGATSRWNSGPGNWPGDSTKLVTGDFNDGNVHEFAALVDQGGSQTELFVIR